MNQVKYLYVKNGDAVEQLERIEKSDFRVSQSGPDAFVGSFLESTLGSEVVVLSRGTRNATLETRGIVAYTRPGGRGSRGKAWRRLVYSVFLARQILGKNPERIICGSTGSQLLICWIFARLMRRPLVHSRHNSIQDGGSALTRIRRAIDLYVIRRVSAVVAHGPFLRDQLVSCGVDPRSIFEFEVGFADRQARPKKDAHNILYVGRIETGKGVFDLLDAASPILASAPQLKLCYVGSGTVMGSLKAAVEKSTLRDRIFLLGVLPHEQVLAEMRDAIVVVTPTRTEFPEGRCMVVLESMAMGVPVIAPNHGPFPYAVSHERNGLLYEADNAKSLSDCLMRITSDKELRDELRAGALAEAARLRDQQTAFATAVARAFNSANSRRA